MELNFFINMIFIFAVNVLFFFSGICLNSLVILSFWRSAQLRKKLCYFMIMVLSCCDLLAVLTNHPLLALIAMFWLTEKVDVFPAWMGVYLSLVTMCNGFSLLAVLVMNLDRYLAISFPIFHRTSVTKGRLQTLLVIQIIFNVALTQIFVNGLAIPQKYFILLFLVIYAPPTLFINYKLFTIARKSRRVTPEAVKKTFSLRNISSCLLTVACFVVLSIPAFVFLVLKSEPVAKLQFDNETLTVLWAKTIVTMNSTFNCLIFYWKNTILRTEGLKIIKDLRISRRT